MKIGTYTVSSNRGHMILEAVESIAPWVDVAVFVDLGITDKTLDIAREVLGDRVHVIHSDPSLTMSAWRNLGLDEAARLGCDWCLTLDTDERIHGDVRKVLETVSQPVDVFMCDDFARRYNKERIFKLPTRNHFTGDVHERIPCVGGIVYLPDVTFYELPKSPERLASGAVFIRDGKLKELAEDPTDARNWYYLGDAYDILGENDLAIEAFAKCADLSKWDAECAWCYVRSALCHRKAGRRWDALQHCAMGLTYHPGYAELAWLAAVCCMETGQFQHAIHWARMAVINGKPLVYVHHGFHAHPFGLNEGPYEILRDAHGILGEEDECRSWAAKAEHVKRSRLGGLAA